MANKDFRDWVFTPMKDRNLYWEKWMDAHPEHKEAVNEARNSLLKLKFKEYHLEESELEEILRNIISNRVSDRNQNAFTVKNSVTWWLKIAASILAIAFSIYTIRYFTNSVRENSLEQRVVQIKKAFNPEGRKSRIKLPDGTIVNLNAGSSLLFPAEFSDTLRIVELQGEAFFDVVRDESRPFIVKTNNLETEVLGTTFNVRAFDEEAEINVALVSGKVKVRDSRKLSNDKVDHYLLPGEKLVYNKSESSYVKSDFDLTEEIGWKDEILVFNNTDFQKFVKLLERWYGVHITVLNPPEKKWSVNGHFKNESLEEVLIGVQFTYDIEYKIDNKSVILNCK